MEDEEKKRNIIFTLESIDNPDYRNLFKEIRHCGKRNWVKKDGKNTPDLKHPVCPPPYLLLDFTHLFDFLTTRAGARLHRLQGAINNSSIQWETFRQGRNRNISEETVEIGICTAAKISEDPAH